MTGILAAPDLAEELRALRAIAAETKVLLRCEDALLRGQYLNLAGRIDALLAIREAELLTQPGAAAP
jgi:hypothetical protein